MNNIDFSNIRPVNGTLNDGFEEFVCQLARKEYIEGAVRFVRNGKPDGGVECYWILNDGSMVFWQAKYFLKSFDRAQFQQIDDSVKTAFRNYNDIKRYIIAIPIDIPDIHKKGVKSMRERMNEYVKHWEDAYPDCFFEVWGLSEIVTRIQMPKCQGLLRFWFGVHEFTNEDFIKQNKAAISDLGIRYTPQNNISLDIWKYFHLLSRDDVFAKYFVNCLNVIEQACNALEKNERCKKLTDAIESCRNFIKPLYAIDLQGTEEIPFDELNELLYDFSDKICNVAEEQFNVEKNNYSANREYERIRRESTKILNIYNAFNNAPTPLVNDPILILEGEAGVGKSHLFADVVTTLSKNGRSSFLFLGQKFTTEEDATIQMLRMANFSGSLEEFLDALECQAQANKHRSIIFIDAINEGRGISIWPKSLHSLIDAIRRYKWVGLALSIRTSYSEMMLPWEEYPYEHYVRARHYGFGVQFMDAVNLYFKNYGIAFPQVPLLSPEFQNPLFLRLFCEGIRRNGYSSIPEGHQGFSSVMELFLDGVEKSLREKKNYASIIKVLPQAIDKFVRYAVENKRHEMPLDAAIIEFEDICPKTFGEGELVELLISEGLFAKNVFYDKHENWVECIYLSYERFENTLFAEYLLKFFDNDSLVDFLLSKDLRMGQSGLFEALAILLPERKGIELYELFQEIEGAYMISVSIMKSLLWRKENTINDHLVSYLEGSINNGRVYSLFLEILLQISFKPHNKFNGDYLHKHMLSMKLADRDAIWVPFLCKQYGNYNPYVKDLISWAWKERSSTCISDTSVLPGVTAMSWLLASTNRELRDTATKGIISLLSNRLHLIVPLLEGFETVDDPYILERLFAICFGCVIRSKDIENIKDISLYIYEHVFNVQGDVYPHILLRDYARETIEYAIKLGIELSIDDNKIRPPYKSSFDYEIVPDSVIKGMMDSYDGKHDKSPGLSDIITSMGTEHSKVFSYGDFGRYTFQSALSHWKISPEALSNIAVMMIIEKYGYDEHKHGSFDSNIGSGRGRGTVPNERIGKKYQWLAMHELAARVSDNCTMLEHSWSDNEIPYSGPWEPFIRDFDPTTLDQMKNYDEFSQPQYDLWWSQPKYDNWNSEIKEWLADSQDLIGGEKIIEVIDEEGEEWLVLEQYPAWAEPHENNDIYKRYWNIVRSYIVDEDNFEQLYLDLSRKNTYRASLPESRDIYQIFYREYYWSPVYKYIDNDYDTESINHHIIESNGKTMHIDTTAICYMWEAENDHSKSSAVRWLIPSQQLVDGMNLHFADTDGVFLDINDKTTIFDGAAIESCPACLLVKKKALLDYLQTNHKRILWNIIGEKNIIGLHDYANVPSWLYMSGCYKLDGNNKVTGHLNTTRNR